MYFNFGEVSASHFNFQIQFIQNSLFFGSKFSFELVIVMWLNILWKGAVINYVITTPPLPLPSHQISAFVLLAYPSQWCQRFIKSARLFFRCFNISFLKHYGYQNIGHSFSFYFSYQTLHYAWNLITVFFLTIFCHSPVLYINLIFLFFFARGRLIR